MVKGKQFAQVRFTQDEVEGEHFSGCRFIGCDFSWLDLGESRFVDCSFYERESEQSCLMQGCDLREASFLRCDLTMVDCSRSQCLGLELRDCQAVGINFAHASFANRITTKSYFCEAHLTGNNFSYASFEGCLLEKCELSGNRWQGANLFGASLAGSDLSGSEFGQIDWSSFSLQGCDLRQCDLPGLDLRRIDLQGVMINEDQQQTLLEQVGLIVFP
ncbi:fluoroquinolone resistance protein [Aeromonas veronii]|uniref:Qnr family pentapeptide repeat protein n=1 Tax=Aeromonas veronii TaxID=654 RepID=UPI0007188805|nr:Qnr family pentapeptide repeat protein [Aeromonas veronii]KRV63138.1 fluoroquinolone resistance protein [Aeromonas veronii]KRV77837.1 fluoroquinolone resistance protein [Aeromonas veronii]KRV88699.1 fluoroquinolone resistance protein [Aeromonas veronii]KRV89480.1 fluoroquinolone resistance protein [Aeromonas veronii]